VLSRLVTIDDHSPLTLSTIAMTQQLSKDIVARLKEMDILASSLSAVSRSGGDERKAMEEAQKEVEKAEAERQDALERAGRCLLPGGRGVNDGVSYSSILFRLSPHP
jgi:hypothetical protein